MAEILTESFCERCGTRYTFESSQPRGARLKGIKVMSRGLRNFVMSDDTSMDEAMAAARNETDREQTIQQLDAFHKTFNFCMNCRQYTCSNCWNEPEGRCLSCAPNLGTDVLQAPFPNLGAGGAVTLTDAEAAGLKDRNGHDDPAALQPMAWPTSDLMQEAEHAADVPSAAATEEPDGIDFAARLEALAGPADAASTPVAEPPVLEQAPEVVEAASDVAEPTEVVPSAPAPESLDAPSEEEIAAILAELAQSDEAAAAAPEAQPLDDRAAAATANTSELFRKFRPGQNLDDEIEAYERTQAAAEVPVVADAASNVATPEPVAAVVEPTAPEPVVEPEPVIAAAEPEPEPEHRAGDRATGPVARRRGTCPATARRRRPTADLADRGPRRPHHRCTSRPDAPASQRAGRRGRRERGAAVAVTARVAGAAVVGRPALPRPARRGDGGHRRAVGGVRTGDRRPRRPGRESEQWRPAVRQLRAVTLRQRPVLPAVRDAPGLIPAPSPRPSGRAPRPRRVAAPGT